MATRMQQRRGTASQWTAANPILAAGEIGFETDTNQFKIGDGVNAWADLSFFKNLEDLDVNGFIADSEKGQPGGVATLTENGNIPISQLGALIDGAPDALNTLKEIGDFAQVTSNAVGAHNVATTDVHGIPDTSLLATTEVVNSAIATEVTDRNAAITALSDSIATDITDAGTAANTYTDNKVADEVTNRNTAIEQAVTDHNEATENVHGIGDTTLLATKSYAETKASDAETAAITAAGIEADTKVSTHNSATTNVHGIANTALLATTDDVATAKGEAIDAAAVASENYTDAAVTALTKASVGLANVDNTSDADKPVSTAQASAIATAKSEAIADATSQLNAVIASAPEALNTLDELAAALGDDANFATTVTNSLALKAPLASPTFTGTVTVAAAGVAFTDGTQTKAGVPSITAIGSSRSSSETLASGEQDKFVPIAGSVTITLPSSGYSTGQSIDFWQSSGTGAQFAGTGVVGTPGLKLRTTYSVATAMKIDGGWLVFGDLSA